MAVWKELASRAHKLQGDPSDLQGWEQNFYANLAEAFPGYGGG